MNHSPSLRDSALKMIEQSQVGQEVPVQILTPGQASLSKLKDVYRQVLYLKHKDKETLLDLKED